MHGRPIVLAGIILIVLASCGDDDPTDTGDTSPPDRVSDLRTIERSESAITLAWTAPGDDGAEGTAARYDIRYATEAAGGASWWDSSTVVVETVREPCAPGDAETLRVESLTSETTYHFALKTADEIRNWSDLSNVLTTSTSGILDEIPPAAVNDLDVIEFTGSSVVLTWTAPGDDDREGTAERYDVRFATEELTADNWESAAPVIDPPEPLLGWTIQEYELSGLVPGTTYWIGLKAVDEASNWSKLSNIVMAEPDETPPAMITDLDILSGTSTSINLSWTAPGDDGNEGQASVYDLRFSTQEITEENWEDALIVLILFGPGPAGTREEGTIHGLNIETIYYFAIKTGDEALNWSALSNVVPGETGSEGGGNLWTLRADGSGDYPTIQAAINAVVPGDVIELEDGTYKGEGNRGISFRGKSITLRSRSNDPEACILDCEGENIGVAFVTDEGPGSILKGITIRNGMTIGSNDRGGGIRCEATSPRILDCILEGNIAAESGGGMVSFGFGTPTIQRCRFINNVAPYIGGGLHLGGTRASVIDCVFIGNRSEGWGGGIAAWASDIWVKDCLFKENASLGQSRGMGGGIQCFNATGTIRGCEFIGNTALVGGGVSLGGSNLEIDRCTIAFNSANDGAGISIDESYPTIENTLVVYNVNGVGVETDVEIPTLECCNLFGNVGGDWVGLLASHGPLNGNLSVDPLFCDPERGDFGLQPDSPCAAENNEWCGTIGARGSGCTGPREEHPRIGLFGQMR